MGALPPEILVLVLGGVAEYRPALARVCRQWAATSAALQARGESPKALTLGGVAERGHAALVAWTRGDGMWFSPDAVLCGAARGGHAHLCGAAREWGAEQRRPMDYNAALGEAASRGRTAICELLISWDADAYDLILAKAANGGHVDLCHAAKARGATNYGYMLYQVASGGHAELCALALEWGLRTAPRCSGAARRAGMRRYASARGSSAPTATPACSDSRPSAATSTSAGWPGSGGPELRGNAHKGDTREPRGDLLPGQRVGARNFGEMLIAAIPRGGERVMRLAKDWGARNFDEMLEIATARENESACRLAKDWGATNFARMLEIATRGENMYLYRLARKWIAASLHPGP